jgi:hypothetical protein
VISTPNTHGSLNLTAGQVNYSPAANYNGPASFDYRVCDNGTTNGAADPKCATGIVNITVNPVNDNPVAVDDSATTDEDTSVTIDVVANDTDVDGDARSLASVGNAVNGSVAILNGMAVFSPNPNFHGTGSFTYTVSDGNGGTDTGDVTVTVNSVNDNPVAVDDSATTDEDTSVTIDVLANDTDVDGDTVTLASVSNPVNGSVSISSGQAVFSPAANFHGTGSFDYSVSDGHGGTATGHVTVTVNSVNDNPVAVDDSATTDEDTSVTIDVVANDTDVDGDAVTLAAVSNPVNGSVVINAGQAVFSPAANFHGTGSFDYSVSDGHGGTANGHVTVTVKSVNDNPVAVDDSATTDEDTSVTINVVANDTDVDGDTRSLASVGNAVNGSVAVLNGMAVFSPSPNFHGAGSFTYTVSDGNGGTDTGDVTVTVNPVNDRPTANSQSVSTGGNTPVSITLTGSDLETSSSNLMVTVTSGPSHGILLGIAPNLIYTPAFNYCGFDSFKFTVTDTGDGSSPPLTSLEATVSINVDDTIPPTITLNGNAISLWPANNKYQTIKVSDLVASASDACDSSVNRDSVVISQVSSDEGTTLSGDIVIAGDCKSVQLRASRNGNGDGRVYTITFRARDSVGNTGTATAKVTVPHNQGNTAVDSGLAYTVSGGCP